MKFGKYLLEQRRPEWAAQYLDYKKLKDDIKAAAEEARKVGGGSCPLPLSGGRWWWCGLCSRCCCVIAAVPAWGMAGSVGICMERPHSLAP